MKELTRVLARLTIRLGGWFHCETEWVSWEPPALANQQSLGCHCWTDWEPWGLLVGTSPPSMWSCWKTNWEWREGAAPRALQFAQFDCHASLRSVSEWNQIVPQLHLWSVNLPHRRRCLSPPHLEVRKEGITHQPKNGNKNNELVQK